MNVNSSVALVSGGASGLGEATVRHLHAGGGSVVIADRDTARGEALAKELGDRARFAQCDVCNEAQAQAAVDLAVSAFGRLTVLVNCAGVGTPAKMLGKEGPLALDTFNRVIQVNLVGSFNMMRLAAAQMAQQDAEGEERGVMINTASIAAYDGQIGQPAYAASKAGVVGMTLPIARELARTGIRVLTIAPGLFETPMMAALPEEARRSLGASVPFPSRLGKPSEYAQLVEAMITNPMFNGETVRLDGALRMAPK